MLKIAAKQTNWTEMYVYQTSVIEDLLSIVIEYVGECEHAGEIANCKEISTGTVDDMEKWMKMRKMLLLGDFKEYLNG